MKNQTTRQYLQYIITELLFFLLFGIILIYLFNYPLKLNRLAYFCASLGFTAIILFNLLKYYGHWYFSIFLVISTVIFTAIIFKTPTIFSVVHHSAWYLLTGVLISVLYLKFYQNKEKLNFILTIVLWIIVFTLIFMIMFFGNAILLKYRHDIDKIEISNFILRALIFGPFLGAGLGTGQVISDIILNRK